MLGSPCSAAELGDVESVVWFIGWECMEIGIRGIKDTTTDNERLAGSDLHEKHLRIEENVDHLLNVRLTPSSRRKEIQVHGENSRYWVGRKKVDCYRDLLNVRL